MTITNPGTIIRRANLSQLRRDPALPPRILRPELLRLLAESLRHNGLLQPLVVRRDPDDSDSWLIVVGYCRFLGASELGWESLDVVVRDDLTDDQVVLLAFESDESEPRPLLEKAWYYARLASGATGNAWIQKAISARENVSEAKVSMYVTIGRTLTPERIEAAGVQLGEAAAIPVTRLWQIARSPEADIPTELRAAAGRSEEANAAVTPIADNFVVKKLRGAAWRADVRSDDVTMWTPDERRSAIESFAPIVAGARTLEALEDPAVRDLRNRLQEEHRRELLDLREEYLSRIETLTRQISELQLALRSSAPRGRNHRSRMWSRASTVAGAAAIHATAVFSRARRFVRELRPPARA